MYNGSTRRPNVYKSMMGLMDMTYKEIGAFLEERRLYVGDVSEICRAVRGFSGPKYDHIRAALILAFTAWVGEMKADGASRELRTFANQMKAFTTI